MEIPIIHEHSRPVKKPVAPSRNLSRPTAPPPPVRSGTTSVNGVSTSGHGGGKSRGVVQTIPILRANDASAMESSITQAKASSTKSSQGPTPPCSSTGKMTTKPAATSTTAAKSGTNSQFLKLATTRSSPGPKPKLPTKPAALRDNPTLILARKSGAGASTNNDVKSSPSEEATKSKASTSTPAKVFQSQDTSKKAEEKSRLLSLSSDPGDHEKKSLFNVRSLSSPGKTSASGKNLLVQGHPSRQTNLHARLPSTDSGIQADGGFDSLSRYKGKSFLSDSSATFDSLECSEDLLSCFCVSPSSLSSEIVDPDTSFHREVYRSVNNSIDGHNKRGSVVSEISNDLGEPHAKEGFGRKNSDSQTSAGFVCHKSDLQTTVNQSEKRNEHCPTPKTATKPVPKRPVAAPRPVSSPPPAPVSGVTSAIPVVRRPPRNRPNMQQPTWRHSAGGPPSRSQDLSGHRKSLAEPPRLNPDLNAGISHRPFPQKVIKTIMSTSLENFSNILGENAKSSSPQNVPPKSSSSGSQNVPKISSSSKAKDKVAAGPVTTPTQAFTLPRSTLKSSSTKAQSYMTVSPPPPPNPQHNVRRLSAPVSMVNTLQLQPTNEPTLVDAGYYMNTNDIAHSKSSAPLSTEHFIKTQSNNEPTTMDTGFYMNTVDISNSVSSEVENTHRAISPPRLHPSIKAFTNHLGAVHVTSNNTPSSVLSSNPDESIPKDQSSHIMHVPYFANINENVNIVHTKDDRDPEGIYQNIESIVNNKRASVTEENSRSEVGIKLEDKTKGEGNTVLTRPLQFVASPGNIDIRNIKAVPVQSLKEDVVSNGLQRSNDLSSMEIIKPKPPPVSLSQLAQLDCYPHRHLRQVESKDQRSKPSVTPRTKGIVSKKPVGLSSDTTPLVKVVVENKDMEPTRKSSERTLPIAIPINPRAPVPSQRYSVNIEPSSKCDSHQHSDITKRMEIPVTHVKDEETFSSSKPSNNFSVSNRTVRSPSIEIKDSIHRSKDEVRKNLESLRPLSLSFPNSPSLLSPSSYSSTLPKNSSFKRDVRSPYRSLLSSRQTEERQKQKEAIYENVRTKLRESFRFEDDASRFLHDDLLLKETDELMKEALEVLNNSSLPSSLSPSSLSHSPSFSQKFFPSPVPSFMRRNRFRSVSSSEEIENPQELSVLPKSPNQIGPSSPTSKVFSAMWRHSVGKENCLNSANSNKGKPKTCLSDFNPPKAEETGTSIPFYDVRSGKTYDNGKDVTPAGNQNGDLLPEKEGEVASPIQGERSSEVEVTWGERKARMDSALSWLKTELAALRDMDNVLICQFRRCQDTIETLKTQRDTWEGLSEEGEECDYWDDYEINEFNKKYLDSPGGSSTSQLSPGSRNSSLYDVTSLTTASPRLVLPGEGRGSKGQILTSANGVTQDVEATV